MEKDRHYRAYDGLKAANNGNTSSFKRSTDSSQTQTGQVRCLCFGGVPDKASHHSFLKGFIINLGICALLVAYTLLGSFIFLAIEGGADGGLQQRTLATTIPSGNQPSRRNITAWLNKVHRDEREKTVERIWGITEQLNILYRDNWTRLAEQEIAHFQDLLLKKIYEDMIPNQHAGTFTGPTNNDGPIERKVPEYEWNFAKAFLYSLTVITTIGERSKRRNSTTEDEPKDDRRSKRGVKRLSRHWGTTWIITGGKYYTI
ncbi:hypothetical protein PV326_003668 [Microctonus aethiopoides]|nr:hypothetical protein PV326_003668 [Microctonus aethiopoides]